MSREFSGNSLFQELSLPLLAKIIIMFGVFRMHHQESKFYVNLVYKLTELPTWTGLNLCIDHTCLTRKNSNTYALLLLF